MNTDDQIAQKKALVLFDQAYRYQQRGELSNAILLYQRSIEVHPTAEAYTFLGWTYSMMDRYDEAIEMCHHAIALDPDYGNPYNDIGVYLTEQEKWEEAIPWFEKALTASRYQNHQFPYMNLGRVYEQIGRYRTALNYYNKSLEANPLYLPAEWIKASLLAKMN